MFRAGVNSHLSLAKLSPGLNQEKLGKAVDPMTAHHLRPLWRYCISFFANQLVLTKKKHSFIHYTNIKCESQRFFTGHIVPS